MPNPVTTDAVSEVSQEATSATNQQQESNLDPRLEQVRQEQEAQPDYSIPEKFKGKSIHDVARSYENLEKLNGRFASEKAHTEKALEEAKARAAQLEQERQALYSQLQQRHQPVHEQQQSEPDPTQSFDQDFEKDPVSAVKGLGKNLIQQTRAAEARLAQQLQAQQANSYYERQKKENPDFAALDADMQQIARDFGGYLRPEVANSTQVIDLLYSLAKSRNMPRYIEDAVKKAQAANNMVNAEKRAAYSESSTGAGQQGRVNPEDMDIEELARLIGKKG